MNVLSLFDGMSCGLQGLKQAGIPVTNYFASEIDQYAMKIALKNHPEIQHIGDVTSIKSENLPKIDLLIGGSPCQGFSNAGKKLNFEDPRSKLFFEYVRILKETKPKYFLLENVNMKQEWIDIISEHVGVKPIAINSNLLSAQTRTRLYWTNIPNITQPTDLRIFFQDIMEKGSDNHYYTEKGQAWMKRHGERKNKKIKELNSPLVKIQCLEASMHKNYSAQRFFQVTDIRGPRYVTPVECERAQTLPDNYTTGVSNTQRYKMLGNGWTVSVIEHIFKNILDKQE